MGTTFIDKFNEIKQYAICIKTNYFADKSAFAFQFEILGEGNGIFYIEYNGNDLIIEPYNYYDHIANIQASADIIIELISGKITINDALRFNDINIVSGVNGGVNRAISFFDACYNSQKGSDIDQSNDSASASSSPWEKLRICIEQSNIDEESKNQLLANLVKFTSKELHILIVGACGCGKSSTINALFNMEIAQVGYGVDPETQEISVYKLDNLYLHDSPGLGESTEKDKEHIKKIKAALQEKDSDGNAIIDVVLVIVDGSHRDMKSSFELINDVVIPNLQHKDRILIGINRCDLALNGYGWIQRYNYPNEELLQRLKEKSDSVRTRIKDDTGVDVEPVFYSALYKYNISKLLSYLVKSAPTKKRVFFAEKLNNNPDNFFRDDTMTLVKKNNTQNKPKASQHNSGHNNSYSGSNNLNKEVTNIEFAISGIKEKIDTIHTDIKSSNADSRSTKGNESIIKNDIKTNNDSNNNTDTEYELVNTGKKQYNQDFQDSMEEAFETASTEINKGSKEKITLSFVNMLDDMKQCAKAGAEFGKEIGKNVPVIGVAIGGTVGAVIGGFGGLLANVFKRRKS